MEEEQSNGMGLVDTLYDQLGIGTLAISQLVNGVVREEIIRSLIAAGILTKDQFSAVLDKALQEANDLCDRVELNNNDEQARELLQRMRDAAKQIVDGMRTHIIEQPSQPPQQA